MNVVVFHDCARISLDLVTVKDQNNIAFFL